MKPITLEKAQEIADNNKRKISDHCTAAYIGLFHDAFLFSYESLRPKTGGHSGCDIFAIVTNNGRWQRLTDDKDITSAIIGYDHPHYLHVHLVNVEYLRIVINTRVSQ